MVSIRQDVYPDFLPDFRNLGVIARMLVGVNLIALAAAALGAESPARAVERFVQIAAVIEPLLLASVALLSVVGVLLVSDFVPSVSLADELVDEESDFPFWA